MKKPTFLILLACLYTAASAQAPNLKWLGWTRPMIGSNSVQSHIVEVDANGHTYIIGEFNGSVDFDPGPAVVERFSGVNMDPTFILKLDALGRFMWVRIWGGANNTDSPMDAALDSQGNLIVTGKYDSGTDLDPGPGTFLVPNSISLTSSVQKFDPNGQMIWAKVFPTTGSGSYVNANSVAVDAQGHVLLAGELVGTVDFDPGPANQSLTAGLLSDPVIWKLDSGGVFKWVRKFTSQSANGPSYIQAVAVDDSGNVYSTGRAYSDVDYDPGAGFFAPQAIPNITTFQDLFISKLDSAGNHVWAKRMSAMGGTGQEIGKAISLDTSGNLLVGGSFWNTMDFDPGAGTANLNPNNQHTGYLLSLTRAGSYRWARMVGFGSFSDVRSAQYDPDGNVVLSATVESSVDLDPGPGTMLWQPANGWDGGVLLKLDSLGANIWYADFSGPIGGLKPFDFHANGDVAVVAHGVPTTNTDMDPSQGYTAYGLQNGQANRVMSMMRMQTNGVLGRLYWDADQDCVADSAEAPLQGRVLLIQPGGILAQTGLGGRWSFDSLPVGAYTVSMLSMNPSWGITCPGIADQFNVVSTSSSTFAPDLGIDLVAPCPLPDLSFTAGALRPGFSGQVLGLQVCNNAYASDSINFPVVRVTLPADMTLQSANTAYNTLGGNQFDFVFPSILAPGQCLNATLLVHLDANVPIGRTLCMQAQLQNIDSCMLDQVPTPTQVNAGPCTQPYDHSHLDIAGTCLLDTARFTITNTGPPGFGNMQCSTQVRVYIDGVFQYRDSVMLPGGGSRVIPVASDGHTVRMEVDQHPLHPGASYPNATVEFCGNPLNFIAGLVNILPEDDADPHVDIQCVVVTGSYDPNDKRGFPLGTGPQHNILPHQELDYMIRFQNTGTDTAFNIVILDTLAPELDIRTVRPGAGSHPYHFRMLGPRVLEWALYDIQLPDSNINEPLSHGFVTFKVRVDSSLSIGTVVENSASIYFDFNAPILTNTSFHTIDTLAADTLVGRQPALAGLDGLRAWPNPNTGLVQVASDVALEDVDVEVFGSNGQLLGRQHHALAAHFVVPLEGPSGLYLLRVRTPAGMRTLRLLKQ